jgi:hypothetical protein
LVEVLSLVNSVTSETRPECNREEAGAEGDAAKDTTVNTGERRGEKGRFSALQISRQCPFVLLVKVVGKQVRTLGSEKGRVTVE